MGDDWKWESKVEPDKAVQERFMQLVTKQTLIDLAKLATAAQELCPPPIKTTTPKQKQILQKLGKEARFILPRLIYDYFYLLAENDALKEGIEK